MYQLLTVRPDIGTCRTLRSVMTRRTYLIVKFVHTNPTYLRHAVAQLVEALRYKLEGRGFDSRWCH